MPACSWWIGPHRVHVIAAAVLLSIFVTWIVGAQRRGNGGRFGFGRAARLSTMDDVDGSFQFCRIVFRQAANGDGGGWRVDWPRADENLSVIGATTRNRRPLATINVHR
jgi:hypothetical protein